jgi:hypothetical protein
MIVSVSLLGKYTLHVFFGTDEFEIEMMMTTINLKIGSGKGERYKNKTTKEDVIDTPNSN